MKINKYERNLCDYCRYDFAKCKARARDVEHGSDFDCMKNSDDNVVYCNVFNLNSKYKSKIKDAKRLLDICEDYYE